MASIALTVGALLALLIALLAVPLTVVFSIHRINEIRGHVYFRWLFGLVRFRLRLPPAASEKAGTEPPPETRARKKSTSNGRRGKKGKPGTILSLLQQSAFRRRIYQFLRDILAASHARRLFLRLRIGTGDPADTGCLWAIVGPIAGLAQNLRGAEVHIEPEFTQSLFEVESHGRFHLVPIQFLALTMGFMMSPTMLRAWWYLSRENA